MEKLQKLARVAALASSIVFELLAGPFLGYFISIYLVKNFGLNGIAVSVGVFIGFLVSLYAVTLTVIKINKISER